MDGVSGGSGAGALEARSWPRG